MLHQTDHRDSIFLLVALTRAFIVYHIRGLKPFSLHPLLRSERLGLHPDMGGGGAAHKIKLYTVCLVCTKLLVSPKVKFPDAVWR